MRQYSKRLINLSAKELIDRIGFSGLVIREELIGLILPE